MTIKQIKARLEYLRGEILNERISYGEIAELQSLAEHIEKDDVQLLEWAVSECSGHHDHIDDLFKCKSCSSLFIEK